MPKLLLIRGDSWSWPGRTAITREIIENTPASFIPHSSQEDSVTWTLSSQGFSVWSAWKAIRVRKPELQWCKVVRFRYHVPRWAIIQCLSILGRLSTKDRMQSWLFLCSMCFWLRESWNFFFFIMATLLGLGNPSWISVVLSEAPLDWAKKLTGL